MRSRPMNQAFICKECVYKVPNRTATGTNRAWIESPPSQGNWRAHTRGRWLPCVKGILSGEIANLSTAWRPPRCHEHHQLQKPQYTHEATAMTGLMTGLLNE